MARDEPRLQLTFEGHFDEILYTTIADITSPKFYRIVGKDEARGKVKMLQEVEGPIVGRNRRFESPKEKLIGILDNEVHSFDEYREISWHDNYKLDCCRIGTIGSGWVIELTCNWDSEAFAVECIKILRLWNIHPWMKDVDTLKQISKPWTSKFMPEIIAACQDIRDGKPSPVRDLVCALIYIRTQTGLQLVMRKDIQDCPPLQPN